MNIQLRTWTVLGTLVAFQLGTGVRAGSKTVTFDDLFPGPGSEWVAIPNGYEGLRWNSLAVLNGLLQPADAQYRIGVVSPDNVAFNLYGEAASIESSNLFDFNSAFLTAPSWNPGYRIQVLGFTGTNVTYDKIYAVNSNAPTLITFNYRGVDQVRLIPSPGSPFALDDVTVTIPADSGAKLDAQLYAGLTITGAVGTVYSVEYVTDLARTNSWRSLEFLQLPASPYLWADKSAPATERRFYRAVAMEAPTNTVFIPPGTFRMGSPTNEVDRDGNEGPQTAVTISRGFWMGKYEVTQGEYLALVGSNPSQFKGDPSRPVEWVTWSDATAYCATLTDQERVAGRIGTNVVYRLPTEAEWEYACRAWTSTRFSYGDDPGYTNLTNYGWYYDNCGGTTHPVGQKLPNPWGLYDMHGNVWEWCQDSLGDYAGGIAVDPLGPGTASYGAFRGGFYGDFARYTRSASRGIGGGGGIGFRVVVAPGQP